MLLAAVKEYGTKFACIPKTLFPNRSTVQLRSRYNNTIKDRHKYQPWTVEDDRRLVEFVTQHGTSAWLECERFLGNKHSRISCRTRFCTIQKHLKKHPNSDIESVPRRKQYTYAHDVTSENWCKKVLEMRRNGGEATFKSLRKRVKNQRVSKVVKKEEVEEVDVVGLEEEVEEEEDEENSLKSIKKPKI